MTNTLPFADQTAERSKWRRIANLLGFLGCAGLLSFGYYLQYFQDLEPCPMCIFQRVAYFFVGIFCLVAAIHHPKSWGRWVYAGLQVITAAIGLGIAVRQVWLQHLPPDQVPTCGPGLDYMLETLPIGETILKVVRGSGDCAEVTWTFLSMSIAEWSVLMFSGLIVWLLVGNTKR